MDEDSEPEEDRVELGSDENTEETEPVEEDMAVMESMCFMCGTTPSNNSFWIEDFFETRCDASYLWQFCEV